MPSGIPTVDLKVVGIEIDREKARVDAPYVVNVIFEDARGGRHREPAIRCVNKRSAIHQQENLMGRCGVPGWSTFRAVGA